MSEKKRAVFFDRDGVLNELVFRDGKLSAPWEISEFTINPRAKSNIKRLQESGLICVVVTNQPDVADRKLDIEKLAAMNELLKTETNVNAVYVCPHGATDNCACRKPKLALIEKAANELNIDTKKSFMVGDRGWDIDSGRAAGCVTIHLPSLAAKSTDKPFTPDFVAKDLDEAMEIILGKL